MSVQDNIKRLKQNKLLVHDTVYRVKIEASMGCNRDCKFCGMTRKDSKIMSMELFDIILKKIPKTVKRIEFILHGEPTLNPNLPLFVEQVRAENPQTQISVCSNGFRFLTKNYNPEYFYTLFEKGVNLLQVDLYEKEDFESFSKLLNENETKTKEMGIGVRDLYSQNINLFFSYRGNKNREVIYVKEFEGKGLNTGFTKQRRFHTFGGNIPVQLWKDFSNKYPDMEKFPLTGKGKTCTSLLKYLSIGAKGDLYLCCRDASHSVFIGNIKEDDLTELWYSRRVQVLRYVLKAARRDLLAPCFLCSRFCYRDGLYPYWGGEQYTKEECIEVIHELTDLKDDVLLDNLIQFQKLYPEKLPEHILKEIETAKTKYNISK